MSRDLSEGAIHTLRPQKLPESGPPTLGSLWPRHATNLAMSAFGLKPPHHRRGRHKWMLPWAVCVRRICNSGGRRRRDVPNEAMQIKGPLTRTWRTKGPFIKDVRTKGGGGVSPKADIVREVAWIYSYRSSQNAEEGGEGVQNPENFADVLYEWSLR